jgi:glycosyltransferase involved in cell wall biosynthesis
MATRTAATVPDDERTIVVDARALSVGHGTRGIGRVARELLLAFADEPGGVEVRGPGWLAERFPTLRVTPVATRVVDGVLSPGPFLRGERVLRLAPVAPGPADATSVSCCHDLMPKKHLAGHFPWSLRLRRPLAVPAYLRSLDTHQRAAAVWVTSGFVANDVCSLLGVPAARVHVIPLAASQSLPTVDASTVDSIRRRMGLPGEFLLWVLGGVNPNKNVEGMLRAHAQGGLPPLIVVGHLAPRVRARVALKAVRLGARVPHFVGYVEDHDLAALNVAASCVVVPSLEEGYGLPLVEACALGARVAANDIPVFREVAGPATCFGDASGDARGFRDAVVRALSSPRPMPFQPRTWRDVARGVRDIAEGIGGRLFDRCENAPVPPGKSVGYLQT